MCVCVRACVRACVCASVCESVHYRVCMCCLCFDSVLMNMRVCVYLAKAYF